MIRMKSDLHGFHDAISEAEAEYLKGLGWYVAPVVEPIKVLAKVEEVAEVKAEVKRKTR